MDCFATVPVSPRGKDPGGRGGDKDLAGTNPSQPSLHHSRIAISTRHTAFLTG